MTRLMVMAGVLVLGSTASAAVEARRYTSLGDVAYQPSEGTPSCGKAARDLLKNAVKGMRVLTVTERFIQMNTGKPMPISDRSEESVVSYTEQADPVPGYPDRVTSFAMMLLRSGDDYRFLFHRAAAAGEKSCSDTYSVSME